MSFALSVEVIRNYRGVDNAVSGDWLRAMHLIRRVRAQPMKRLLAGIAVTNTRRPGEQNPAGR